MNDLRNNGWNKIRLNNTDVNTITKNHNTNFTQFVILNMIIKKVNKYIVFTFS